MDASFSVSDVRRVFEFKFDDPVISELQRTTPSEPLGDENLILVPGYPLSLVELIQRFRDPQRFTPDTWSWVRNMPFAHEPLKARWYVLGQREYPCSLGLNYSDELKLVQQTGRFDVANVTIVAYAALLSLELRGKPLFPGVQLRCTDTDKSSAGRGKHVGITHRSPGQTRMPKIAIERLNDEPCKANVGIAYIAKSGR